MNQIYLNEIVAEDASLSVRNTSVGKGVFAERAFPKNSVVGDITGVIIDDPNYGSDYSMCLGDGRSLEPGPPFRFLNHSCDPNCDYDWDDVEDPETGQVDREVYLVAKRDIFAGEQLTIDYNWPANCKIACKCGSDNCRGWVVSLDELHLI